MSNLDQVEAFASAIIARDLPVADYQTGPARAAPPGDLDPRLWAYKHRSQAEVIAAEIGTPFERHVEAWLIDARQVLSNPMATRSQRELAERTVARWGM